MVIVIIYWLLLIVMLVGVAGAVIPGLPGSSRLTQLKLCNRFLFLVD